MSFSTSNPATGETLMSYNFMTESEVQDILSGTHDAQKQWRTLSVQERSEYFVRLAQVLRENLDTYATLMTQEMGKPIKESKAEIEKCAWLAECLAKQATQWLAEEQIDADGKKHVVRFDPLGVLFLIMPWNFPFWQPMKVALPPLIAGNGIVLKHAKNVTGSALAVEDAFRKAGFPKELFRTIIIDHDMMPKVLESNHVHAGSLTGSERAGSAFASAAGKELKKVVMELGGSDPCIVCEDADIALAAKGAAKARMMNAGQVCIAAKRILVHESIQEAFTKAFVEEVAALQVGDPLDPDTDIGPLVNTKAVAEMEAFVKDAVDRGASILTGGKQSDLGESYFEPTVLADVDEQMAVSCQEVFGPIAPIMTFRSEQEAISFANDSPYGLSASIWSQDTSRAQELAKELDCGSVFINSLSKTDPRLPVGGIKRSGFGRELSAFGIREFVNIKSINVY